MEEIKLKSEGMEEKIVDGQNPRTSFENLGIAFSCSSGVCGTCKIKINEGNENINEKTEEEEDYPLREDERLACQCEKISGDIEFENRGF